MYVEHSGWSEKQGAFHYNIFFNENKNDYEIHYKSGAVLKQSTAFEEYIRDWNHDGDVYPLFGAYFERIDEKGSSSSKQFWTPENMVMELIEGKTEESNRYYDVVVSIPGIEVPEPGKRPTLESQIRDSERRSMAQDIECNQRMNALGIRSPGEPWAR